MIKDCDGVVCLDGKRMDRRQALRLKRNEKVYDGERKSDTTENFQKSDDTRSLYVRSLGDIEKVWWVTQRSGLVRIRGTATSCTSCMKSRWQRNTRHWWWWDQGWFKGQLLLQRHLEQKCSLSLRTHWM